MVRLGVGIHAWMEEQIREQRRTDPGPFVENPLLVEEAREASALMAVHGGASSPVGGRCVPPIVVLRWHDPTVASASASKPWRGVRLGSTVRRISPDLVPCRGEGEGRVAKWIGLVGAAAEG
jgi:hypothetical protein